ncbi:MAG: hypothetical protein KTR20_05425 [Cellvibrionaceae bacterium]|nr:hypothetical protein [Cellvibrionaceae bacterium]
MAIHRLTDDIIKLKCHEITSVFIEIVGFHMGSRAQVIWEQWRLNYNRHRMINRYIDALAQEIAADALRETFVSRAYVVLQQDIPMRMEDLQKSILGDGLGSVNRAIVACINGEGL